MRIIFMGTPAFAAHPLRALAADPRFSVVGVVTQPDRPAKRSGLQPPPVKQAALELGIPVLQPETLKDPSAVEWLAALRPDVGVVAAYGEILRRNVLELPPLGYLNIHPSLLPLHRGPAPITGAILAGEAETGVSIMLLEAKMDAGPIVRQVRVPLAPDARAGALTDALFQLGAQLLPDTLAGYAAGTLTPQPQDHAAATYTRLLSRQDGAIDWTQPATQIERMTRAYDPWPGAYTTWRGAPLKILAASVVDAPDQPDTRNATPIDLVVADAANIPGTLSATPAGPVVATGAGNLLLVQVQPAGQRALAAKDWWRGQQAHAGPNPAFSAERT